MDGNRGRPIKVTVVGDGLVGKRCLIVTYTTKEFPTDDVVTVFDNYEHNIEVDGEQFDMTLSVTAGQDDYGRLRPLSHSNTDCFLLCYSVASRNSYDNVSQKWQPEIQHFSPNVPIVLVATKTDLRKNEHDSCISTVDGIKLKKKIRATALIECSALERKGLQKVFVAAVRALTKKKIPKKRVCQFL